MTGTSDMHRRRRTRGRSAYRPYVGRPGRAGEPKGLRRVGPANSVAQLVKGGIMPTRTSSLVQEVRAFLERLDAMDIESLGSTLAEDAQSVDEITRGWTRGR